MKRAIGLLTIAGMLCAQTVSYAAEQMTKERETGKQSGQETQRAAGQEMQRQASQPEQAGSVNFSEEMQRQSQQSLQSGQQSQCQRSGKSQQVASQQPTGQPSGQAGQQSASQQPAGQQPSQGGHEQSPQDLGKQAQGQQTQSPPTGAEPSRHSQAQQSSPGMASGGTMQTLQGQFVRMESEFYVIKDQSGKEVCIPTSYATFIDQTCSAGDNIVARLLPDGTAAVTGRSSEGQMASSGSSSQDRNSGMKEQGQTASQGQAMGTGAGEQPARGDEKSGTQQNAQLVKGELLKIQDEFYTVKEQSGNEIRLHVNKETKVEGNLNIGDKIEAQRTPSGHALYVKKSEGATSSK